MKMKFEEIVKKLKELKWHYDIEDFISSLNLTSEQLEILSENEYYWVRCAIARHPDLPKYLIYKLAEDEYIDVGWEIAQRPDLPEDLMYKLGDNESWMVRLIITERIDLPDDLIIRLSCDFGWLSVSTSGFENLEKLKNLKSEDLENAYDLIRTSKYIGRKQFEEIFDYIISNFPDLSEAAKLFKSIILKGKKNLI
jgi:hypothetical protein